MSADPHDAKQAIKPRRLTRKQQSFIDNYTDPDKPTFGNGTQSVLAIPHRNGDSYKGATVQAIEYLAHPTIRSEIEALAESVGATDMFRLSRLHLVAQGQYVTTETSERIIKGKVRKVTTTRTPKASEIVKAVDTLNKMTGRYEKNRVAMNALSSRFKELAKQYKPTLERPVAVKAVKRTVKRIPMLFGLCPLQAYSEPTSDTDSVGIESMAQ